MTDAFSFSNIEASPMQALIEASAGDRFDRQQFLRLHLVPETTALLAVKNLAEVLTVPIGQIVPVSHLPVWVMGIYNWRGEILWMVDLGHLCGLTPWFQQAGNLSTHTAIVLNGGDRASDENGSRKLGLVVNRVEDVEWCDPDQIQALSSTAVLSRLSNFLCGYWWKANDATLAVLDAQAIIAAMPN